MKMDIKHTAELSRIRLTDDELKEFTPQMESILKSVEVLKEKDTTDILPMKEHIPFDSLRNDIPKSSLTQEEVLKNCKHTENGCAKIYGDIFGSDEG
ncbi:MAG TPA: Asp-tRNA(Asn)/Glu-tRNA(Gln) amidotransferase subunit GatC [Candidatus Dojkabacteria bacterium]|jgi:aspartyl-tRNA(Asn)/glutamyl-tRNA(Gln) amidotransferase subunit C|nr:Asp-tRNA(Asn)/Glu-tRNA(Gln) amidotransferase subunit GatC [Candidatus Dojkabacteria bacterium]